MSFSPPQASPIALRRLTVADVPEVLRIQALCYGDSYTEGASVYTRRLQAPHHCSWAAEQGGRVVAYLAAYWSLPGKITPLHGDFEAVEGANVLYLHDMAVEPALAGQGLAERLWQAAVAEALARGVQRAALVAVQGAASYWARRGFGPTQLADAQQQMYLASYGSDAVYMARSLGD